MKEIKRIFNAYRVIHTLSLPLPDRPYKSCEFLFNTLFNLFIYLEKKYKNWCIFSTADEQFLKYVEFYNDLRGKYSISSVAKEQSIYFFNIGQREEKCARIDQVN